VFHELHAVNGFTEFRSAANRAWLIGFNRRGRRLPGDAAATGRRRRGRRRRRCYQFTKTDFPYVGGTRRAGAATGGDRGGGGVLGDVDWYSWIASRRRTDATAVT